MEVFVAFFFCSNFFFCSDNTFFSFFVLDKMGGAKDAWRYHGTHAHRCECVSVLEELRERCRGEESIR